MRAIICHGYGDPEAVLRVEDVDRPTPGDDDVLVKVRAAAVNPLDSHLMKGKPYGMRLMFGLTRPRLSRPGRDVAGQVEAVGRNVTQFEPGDEVFGVCRGAFADYACAAEAQLARKPPNVTVEQAASAPIAGITALQGLRDKGRLQAGQRVLVNGAAGGVGIFAVQVAKAMGAEVTGVCSTRNVEIVRSLGADRVVDYTRDDFTRAGDRYDVVLDCICNHSLLGDAARAHARRTVGHRRRPSRTVARHHDWKPGQAARRLAVRQPGADDLRREHLHPGPDRSRRVHGRREDHDGHRPP